MEFRSTGERAREREGIVEIDRKAFASGLRAVKPAVANRGIPALTGVMIESNGERVTLATTNLETSIRTTVDAPSGECFRVLAPHAPLAAAIGKGTGTVEIGPEDGAFRAGSVTLRLLPVEDFPGLSEVPDTAAIVDAQAFRALADTVLPAVSRDDSRPVLTGILFEIGRTSASEPGRPAPEGLAVTATDSYRLHHAETTETLNATEAKAVVPADAVKLISKAVGRKGTGEIEIGVAEMHAAFRYGNLSVTVRAIEAEFPNYRMLVPEDDSEQRLTFDPDALLAAVREAATFSPKHFSPPVRVALNGKIDLSLSSPDLGTYAGSVEGEWAGEDLSTAFNPAYLADALAATGAGVAYLRDGLKPVKVGEGMTRTAMVMPVRLPAPVA